MDAKAILDQIAGQDPAMADRIKGLAGNVSSDLFKMLANRAKGTTRFKHKSFKMPEQIVGWLNENKDNVVSWQLMHSFTTMECYLIYEEFEDVTAKDRVDS